MNKIDLLFTYVFFVDYYNFDLSLDHFKNFAISHYNNFHLINNWNHKHANKVEEIIFW